MLEERKEMDRSVIGAEKYAISTPALLVDLEKMECNITRMADFFRDKEANLRPHIKTHKTPMIAHKQIEAGAIGITCQKLAEAEVMAEAGLKDILIANEIVGAQKINRLVNLARYTRIKVAVDNSKNIVDISDTAQRKGVKIGVLIEVNIGLNRCGVTPGEPALKLAREVEAQKGLEFFGLMGYEGHTVFIKSYQERECKTKEALNLLVATRELLQERRLECRVVSAGGTGTYDITGSFPGITEVQAGSYVTMDTNYSRVEKVGGEFKQALSLLTTVISKPTDDRAILDAGMKSISIDMGIPGIAYPVSGRVGGISEEHISLIELEGATKKQLGVGEKIEIIPSHACTTMNLHDYFYGIRDGIIELIWSIKARGKFE